MKHKFSVSMEEDTLLKLKDKLRGNKLFRNKSHLIELAVEEFLNKNEEQ